MPSYVIAGASRGIGFEFLRQLSLDPAATVIGLVRDTATTEKKVAEEIKRPNVHIIQGDLTDYESLKKAAENTAKITGGKVDYLIANGAYLSLFSAYKNFGDMVDDPKGLEDDLIQNFRTNAIGAIHLFNAFLPLIRKGDVKKAIAISTGACDVELIRNSQLDMAAPYAMSKAALNVAVAKFHAEFCHEGILFMSISPGVVDTAVNNDTSKLTEKELQSLTKMMTSFGKYAPHFKGPMKPEESVKAVMNVINNASVERGDGGSFISHLGTKQWI
ncbi:NAD(P)-binding protein [Hypomontagnella submonticulosa]|nr:NAD(P)-binding protein [Hypomontagnella submonticulosa]